MEPRIWLIAGPTASGKSALALRLAEAVGGQILNADSMQLYRDLRILTARPSKAEERRAPHHLFGTVDAADGWSVGRWLRAASEVLGRIDGPTIVVGGTGLYFKALTEGLAEIPRIAADVRRAMAIEFEVVGEPTFRARLAKVDPAAAARIAPGDRQRLVRAWEVYAATGRPLSEHHASAQGALPAGSWNAVALEPPRTALYARCDARLEAMVEAGALEEVRALVARRLDPDVPAMKAVGVREFAAHLQGGVPLSEAVVRAQQETRRYAKRQMTWMRGQMGSWPRVTAFAQDEQWGQFLALTRP